MASGQSMARAWLMGAISPRRNRQSAHTDPPEPASSGGFFIFWSAARLQFHRRKPERETRIPGLAQGPSIDRTVESVQRDGCVAGCGEAQSRTCVSIVGKADFAFSQRALS